MTCAEAQEAIQVKSPFEYTRGELAVIHSHIRNCKECINSLQIAKSGGPKITSEEVSKMMELVRTCLDDPEFVEIFGKDQS